MAWSTTNATTMNSMFKGASSFNQPIAGGESSGGDPIIEAVNSATFSGAAGGGRLRVTNANASSLKVTGDVTISVWARHLGESDPYASVQLVAGFLNFTTDQQGYGLLYNADSNAWVFRVKNTSNTNFDADSDRDPVDGEWEHLIGEYDGTNVKLYVNDAVQTTSPAYTGLINTPDSSVDFDIGGASGNGNYPYMFNGNLSDLAVYNRTLTSTEKTYLASNPFKCWDLKVVEMPSLADALMNPSLSTWTDYTTPTLDPANGVQIDSVTGVDSVTYTDQGLSVDCGTTPIVPGTGGLDTSLVQSMDSMFDGATAFDQDLAGLDVTSLTSAPLMFNGVQLGEANYDSLLNGWEAQAVNDNVTFDGGLSIYCDPGEPARDALINDHSWTITDGGKCINNYYSYYRVHQALTTEAPTMKVSNLSNLVIESTAKSVGSFYLLLPVSKSELENNKIYLDLGLVSSHFGEDMQRQVLLFEGSIEGNDALFVNGAGKNSPTPDFTLLDAPTNSNHIERFTYDLTVPDLSSVTSDTVTIAVKLYDGWLGLAIDWTIYDLEIRSLADDPIRIFDLTETKTRTGHDGISSYGTISNDTPPPYVPATVTLTDALGGSTGPFLQTYDVYNGANYEFTIHYGAAASLDNSPHEGWNNIGGLPQSSGISYWPPYPGAYYLSYSGDQVFTGFINGSDGLAGINFGTYSVVPSDYE